MNTTGKVDIGERVHRPNTSEKFKLRLHPKRETSGHMPSPRAYQAVVERGRVPYTRQVEKEAVAERAYLPYGQVARDERAVTPGLRARSLPQGEG